MSLHPVDGIAAVIRQHRNGTDPDILGAAIALHFDTDAAGNVGCNCGGCADIVAGIIRRVNPNRTMGAGALAEAIWNDLNED